MLLLTMDEWNDKFITLISEWNRQKVVDLEQVIQMVVIHEKTKEHKRKILNSKEWKFIATIKKQIKEEIGLLDQKEPLSLNTFIQNEDFPMLFFFFCIASFDFSDKKGIAITTKGREFKELRTFEVFVLRFLILSVMHTKMSQIRVLDSPASITDFFKSFTEQNANNIKLINSINEESFYAIARSFGYPYVKNRKNLSGLTVQVKKSGEAIVAAKNKVESEKTAGFYFKEDDFKLFLDYVNDYENVADDKGIKVKESDDHIGDGCFSTVTKGEFIIKSKHPTNNNRESVWKGEVAIKKMNTSIKAKDLFKPQYEGDDEVTNTEIYVWLSLHGGEYVHPEDFERYKEMPRVVRHAYGQKRSIVKDIYTDYKDAGNVLHGVLPIYYMYVSVNEENYVIVNFVSPLMEGSIEEISYDNPNGNFVSIAGRLKTVGSKRRYKELFIHMHLDMLSSLDMLHNNSEYTNNVHAKNFLHADVKPSNFVYCLKKRKRDDASELECDEVMVLLCDFGLCVKLTQKGAIADHYKVINETVDLERFYSLAYKGRNLSKMQFDMFGEEIKTILQNKVMVVEKEDKTKEKRLLYGFSEVADLQGLALTLLYLRCGRFYVDTPKADRDEYFPYDASEPFYSHKNIARLLVDNDLCVGNDTVISKEHANFCSFITRQMMKIIELFKIDARGSNFETLKGVDRYVFAMNMPYSIRPRHFFLHHVLEHPLEYLDKEEEEEEWQEKSE